MTADPMEGDGGARVTQTQNGKVNLLDRTCASCVNPPYKPEYMAKVKAIGDAMSDASPLDPTACIPSRDLFRGEHSDQLHVTERWTRAGDVLTWEATVEDPVMFTKPWVMTPRQTQIAAADDYIRPTMCVPLDKGHIVKADNTLYSSAKPAAESAAPASTPAAAAKMAGSWSVQIFSTTQGVISQQWSIQQDASNVTGTVTARKWSAAVPSHHGRSDSARNDHRRRQQVRRARNAGQERFRRDDQDGQERMAFNREAVPVIRFTSDSFSCSQGFLKRGRRFARRATSYSSRTARTGTA